jgi:hypothetical protein
VKDVIRAYRKSTGDNPATPSSDSEIGELFLPMLENFLVAFDANGTVRNTGAQQLWREGTWRRSGGRVSVDLTVYAGQASDHEELFRIENSTLIWEGLYGVPIVLRGQERE